MKRNCERTQEEKAVHDRASKLRRLTDDQLCDAMDSAFGRGVDEGLRMAGDHFEEAPLAGDGGVAAFIDYLEGRVGTGNKIGKGTILQLHRELEHFGRVAQ